MSNIFRFAAAGAVFMLATAAGFAQDQYNRQAPYYGPGGVYERGQSYYGRAYGGPTMSEIDQIGSDIDQALSTGYLSDEERKTLEHARKDLYDFERAWIRGKKSYHELNEAINRIQGVADRGRMDPRTRDILADDAARLRELWGGSRSSARGYGYR